MQATKLNVVRLNIQLTKKCNQRCRSCNSYDLKAESELGIDDFLSIIDEATNLFCIKNIAFTGGEPTLHPGILEVAKAARAKSPNVSVTTNGFYCKSKETVEKLLIAGINRFSFSYHGVGAHDDFTRTKGAEKRLRQAVDWVLELQSKYPSYVKIGTLYTGRNIEDVEAVLQYAHNKGMDLYIELLDTRIPVFKASGLSKSHALLDKNGIKKDIERIKKWKMGGYRILISDEGIDFLRAWFMNKTIKGECPLYDTDLYIESDGTVRTGCWSLPGVGNIKKNSLSEIVVSDKYQENIENMKRRKCTGCTCGYLMQAKAMQLGVR